MKFDNSNLDVYINKNKNNTLLSKSEEILFVKNFKEKKDITAIKKLVESNLNYIVKVARNYSGYGLIIKDLVQVGVIGLMKAIKNFDTNKNIRLISFAIYWVKAEIHEYIIKNLKIVKIIKTKNQKKLFFNLKKIKNFNTLTLDEKKVISNFLNVKKKDIDYMINNLNKNDLSIDDKHDEQNYVKPKDLIYHFRNDPLHIIEKNNWLKYINKNFHNIYKNLDKRSRNVMFYRWLSDKKYTLKELSLIYNVSSERIRQVEKNVLNKLKIKLNIDNKIC